MAAFGGVDGPGPVEEVAERRFVAGVGEQSGPAVLDEFGEAATAEPDHRCAQRERLDHGRATGFLPLDGEQRGPRGRHQPFELGAVQRARPADDRAVDVVGDLVPPVPDVRVQRGGGVPGESVEQRVLVEVRPHRPGEHQRPAGPVRQPGGDVLALGPGDPADHHRVRPLGPRRPPGQRCRQVYVTDAVGP
ncbi:hypothetical protein GCM10029964_054390 [Kibdelosporangium lantanae]